MHEKISRQRAVELVGEAEVIRAERKQCDYDSEDQFNEIIIYSATIDAELICDVESERLEAGDWVKLQVLYHLDAEHFHTVDFDNLDWVITGYEIFT